MDAHTVGPFPTRAHAFLGTGKVFHTFRMNPDDVSWDYAENTASFDTIGGRVVQLLSVAINGITVNGRAGSRGELQRLAENVRRIMQYHITTSRPVTFRVPSRKWDFTVYVQAMPSMGWDVASTSYPYSIQLLVEEDISGIQSKKLEKNALTRLAENVGYRKGFHGGGAKDAKGFQEIVDTVLSAQGGGGGGFADFAGVPPYTGTAVYRGSNSGTISSQDTPALQIIERALKANGMLPPGRTCGSDTVPGPTISEHAFCNAKDCMVSSGTATGQAKENGDAIASYLVEALLSDSLPINTIIWYRKSFSRSTKRWESYHGVSDHTDHVHVSGYPSRGGGG